jgi:desulfoferrodoxin (superoxide reductase-like protein)
MRMKIKKLAVCLAVVAGLILAAGSAEANKASVVIETPVKFDQNGKAVVKLTVHHSGNNFIHHTQWLRVLAGGKEIARWDFSWKNKPENEVFSREVAIDVTAPLEIEAEASCNLHGSKGPAKMTVTPPGKAQ